MSAPDSMPLSATLSTPAGILRAKTHGGIHVHPEGAQVAIVDANEVATEIQRASEFVVIVHLTEHVEGQSAGDRMQAAQLLAGERSDDEENGVGVMGARFQQLELVDDEVLAQAGQGGGSGGLGQVGDGALKEFLVGEHRERGGAGRGQLRGQAGDMKAGANHAPRGRGPLQFGDDGRTIGGDAAQGGGKPARR